MFKKSYIDYLVGIEKETQLLPIAKKYFNDESIYKLDKHNIFDFQGNNKFIELKSRNNEKNKYLTTMIGYNKIMKASELEEDVYFIFSFTDGIYYWKYDKNFNLEIKKNHCSRKDRGCSEINDYAFIPVNISQKIII